MKLLTITLLMITTSWNFVIQTTNWPLKYGRYNCTASKYINGSYEFQPRGYFVLKNDKTYSYHGFEKPSNGTFSLDKQGNILFKDGYLNGGKAEKTDREDRFLLVFPANLDNRWTSTLSK